MAKKKMKINFGDVEGKPGERRGRTKRIPEGDYLAKITKQEPHKTERGRSIHWQFQVTENAAGNKKHKGTVFHYYTSLKPEALFNLRNLIFAASGKNVTGKSINFDPDSLIGKVIGIIVEDEEYKPKGKDARIQSRCVDVIPRDQLEAEDEDDEDEDDEDEDEDDEDEDEDEDDDDEDDEDEDDLDDVDDDDL